MSDLNEIISSNITQLRKRNKLTQAELAEKLNYSDKAVSKWERGEAIPDVAVLKQIADNFGVTLDYMVNVPSPNKIQFSKKISLSKSIITALSVILVWLIATIVFVALTIAGNDKAFLAFVIGIPVALLVAFILSAVWKHRIKVFVLLSLFIWAVLGSIFVISNNSAMWPIFLIGVPLQVAVVLWFLLIHNTERRKNGSGKI